MYLLGYHVKVKKNLNTKTKKVSTIVVGQKQISDVKRIGKTLNMVKMF